MNARTGSLHLGDPVPDFTLEERTLAESCVRKLGIRIPALVDDVVNGIEAAYTGWPDCLYVIDRTGGWVFPFIASLVLLLVGAILAFRLRPDEPFKDDATVTLTTELTQS